MNIITEQLKTYPLIALFLSIALGYLIGKIKFGKFQLGGVAGTLLVAVSIGQLGGIYISPEIKSIFFALFIFMVGYNGGPQFFSSFKLSALTRLFAAFLMTLLGLLTVLAVSIWSGLNPGLAAGLAAGGLTQSAIIGTASSAINQLGLSPTLTSDYKTNVAVGYSITYIFGSLGPILMISILPLIYKWNLRKEATDLATKLGGGVKEISEGEFKALNRMSCRAYSFPSDSPFIGKSPQAITQYYMTEFTIRGIVREQNGNNTELTLNDSLVLQANDIIIISGLRDSLSKLNTLGNEVGEFSSSFDIIEKNCELVLTNKKLLNKTVKQIHESLLDKSISGIYITSIRRMGHELTALPSTELHTGDEITLTGDSQNIKKAISFIGYPSPLPSFTDYIIMSASMVLGFLIGELSIHVGSINISLGSGLGCLLSGLIIGYLRMRVPRCGQINSGAASFMQTFGLAIFVAAVGLDAGAPALIAIKEHGVTLLLLSVVVTLIPQIIEFLINYYLFKIKNPVEALALIAGSRSANPAFATLLEKTGNSTPVPTFTMSYAVANIFLTLWGPVVVAIISKIN
ncbi:aspartate-alanine antiporter [Photobacterium angustum]|uniref:aspartate-alanine antiporter n=1 Tax=Photobacterium angustum TaxID=661 RepID=UPI0005DF54B7|nr:aspartate-alanine antiporter [Photobacterium angustum]KJF96013.1 transporter [Photobacterium angustum]PSW80027.1 aspartate-alanine antiporter [Photobacterium angustum]